MSYFGLEVTGELECRQAVRRLIKDGADCIKITATGGSTRTSFRLRPSFSAGELSAICDEARRFGKPTIAHCNNTQGMLNSLEAGVDTIAHANFVDLDGTNRYRPEVAERIAKQGTFINPTLGVLLVFLETLEDMIRQPVLTADDAAEMSIVADKTSDTETVRALLQKDRDRRRRIYEQTVEALRNLRDLGVRIIAGSDSGFGRYRFGEFQRETDALVNDAGMTPIEAISASTVESAESCGVRSALGTFEPGAHADAVVVEGDATKDIKAL